MLGRMWHTGRKWVHFRGVSHYHMHIELEAAHAIRILAQACIGILLRLDDHVDLDNMEDFPLEPYAAEH
jgi:hypothetical protein